MESVCMYEQPAIMGPVVEDVGGGSKEPATILQRAQDEISSNS